MMMNFERLSPASAACVVGRVGNPYHLKAVKNRLAEWWLAPGGDSDEVGKYIRGAMTGGGGRVGRCF